MSIRTVSYLLNGENDLPESPQYGGVRYENNATSVAFTLDENYKFNIENAYPNTQLVYRIDFNSRNAGYNPSENLVLTDNAVSRTIPLCMTFYGEQITATLVITAIDDDGNAVGTILSPEIKIYFDDVTKDEPTSSVIGENISAIEKRTEEFCVLAEKQAELAEGFADIAADNATFSQAAADNAADSAAIAKSAEQNTETVVENHKADASAHSFLFDNKVDKADGMGLSSNDYTLAEKEKLTSIENGAQVNIAPDQTYSPTSENAQSGKAVAQALSGRTPIEIADGSLAINFTDNGIYEIIGVEIYGTNYEVYTEYGSVYVPNSTPPAQLVVGAKFYIELGESINNYTRNINKLELVGNPYVKEDNIKTINGESIIGSGDIAISGGETGLVNIDQTYSPTSENAQSGKAVAEAIAPLKEVYTTPSDTLTCDRDGRHSISRIDLFGDGATLSYKISDAAPSAEEIESGSVSIEDIDGEVTSFPGTSFTNLGEGILAFYNCIVIIATDMVLTDPDLGNLSVEKGTYFTYPEYIKKITLTIPNYNGFTTVNYNLKTINGNSLVGSGDIAISSLKGFELLSDVTITEDVEEVKWRTTDSGEPISKYKDFFIYFLGKFTADDTAGSFITCSGDGLYFMYKWISKSTKQRAFWVLVETICSTDKIDVRPNELNGTAIRIGKFPDTLLENVGEGDDLFVQGLSAQSRNLGCDTTVFELGRLAINEIKMASKTVIFASGSRFLLFGR